MPKDHSNLARDLQLERYRGYLLVLAETRGKQQPQHKLDASDIVQQTLLKAHEARDDFRGGNSAEVGAWLRQILVRTLIDAQRDLYRGKRNAALERSLDQSSNGLERLVAASQDSPSSVAACGEQILLLADAVATLPEPQRAAVLLKHCDGLSVADICIQLGRTPAAVASLLRRGLKQLREKLEAA